MSTILNLNVITNTSIFKHHMLNTPYGGQFWHQPPKGVNQSNVCPRLSILSILQWSFDGFINWNALALLLYTFSPLLGGVCCKSWVDWNCLPNLDFSLCQLYLFIVNCWCRFCCCFISKPVTNNLVQMLKCMDKRTFFEFSTRVLYMSWKDSLSCVMGIFHSLARAYT